MVPTASLSWSAKHIPSCGFLCSLLSTLWCSLYLWETESNELVTADHLPSWYVILHNLDREWHFLSTDLCQSIFGKSLGKKIPAPLVCSILINCPLVCKFQERRQTTLKCFRLATVKCPRFEGRSEIYPDRQPRAIIQAEVRETLSS
jgi:hypothetical protein